MSKTTCWRVAWMAMTVSLAAWAYWSVKVELNAQVTWVVRAQGTAGSSARTGCCPVAGRSPRGRQQGRRAAHHLPPCWSTARGRRASHLEQ